MIFLLFRPRCNSVEKLKQFLPKGEFWLVNNMNSIFFFNKFNCYILIDFSERLHLWYGYIISESDLLHVAAQVYKE